MDDSKPMRTLRPDQFWTPTRNFYVQVGSRPTIIAHTKGNGIQVTDVTRYNQDPGSNLHSGLRAAKLHAEATGSDLIATTIHDHTGRHTCFSVAVWAANKAALEPFYEQSERRPLEILRLDPAPVPWELLTPEEQYVIKVDRVPWELPPEQRVVTPPVRS